MTDEQLMQAALEEARAAAALGEVPVGAVVAKDGEIIARAHNLRESGKNAIYHAELLAIDAACKALGGWRLWQCELFVTLEPCPMCSGAIINSRLKRVVYGARDPKAGCCGSLTDLFALPFNHHPVMEQGLLEEEAQALLQEFFAGLRAKRLKLKAEKRAQQAVPLQNEENPMNDHVLITGGSRGIGAATVLEFARAGYDVAFTWNSREDAALDVVQQAQALNPGGRFVALHADVSDSAQVNAAVQEALQQFGSLQALICCAGIAQQKLFTDLTDEDWHRMMGVDLDGVFYACRAVLPGMIRQKYGRILLVSSMWGQTGGSCEVHYSAAKAGVIGLTKALAKEEGPSGITVNCVAPGVIETDMMASFTAEDKAALAEETPVERLGTPEEVARTLVFLAGRGAGFITGQVLGVNGGIVI